MKVCVQMNPSIRWKCKLFNCFAKHITFILMNRTFPYQYLVKTKYFHAPVTFHSYATSVEVSVANSLEGMIVLAEKDSIVSPDFVVPEYLSDNHVKLLVIIVPSDGDRSEYDESREHRVDWALDHGFEYIEVEARDLVKSKQLTVYVLVQHL